MRWFWLALILCQLPVAAQPPTATRLWTDSTGKYQVSATYVGVADGQVTLRKENGQTVAVPLERLSRADQEFVQSAASAIVGQVVGVSDGDTITVLDANKEQFKIRLEGIDTPESNQAYGTRAKQALSDKVFGKRVHVVWKERDRYKRILGWLYLDDRLINKEMVQEGWAWHYKQYSNDPELAHAEESARSSRKGLWADANPIAPWDFRRNPSPNPRVVEKPEPPTPPETQAATVYVTRTGAKYHTGGCRYLSKSKIPISLNEAKGRYSPCSVCNPPQ